MITDYHQDHGGDADEALDDHVGVAVEFDENEDDEEETDLDMVEEEEDDNVVEPNGAGAIKFDDDDVDDDIRDSNAGMCLHVHDIDAYWLQRMISQAYQQQIDPQQCHKLAQELLKKILAQWDDWEVETKLLLHLHFHNFNLIKFLLHNRLKIVWCTRLARAQDQQERKKIEEEMMSLGADNLAAILKKLHATRANAKERQNNMEKSVREEVCRLKDDRDRTDLVERDADGGWLKGQRQFLDLDNLAFEQGGLLMANNKCEEVHVPALKPKPFEPNEKFVQISQMPAGHNPPSRG